MNPTEWLDDDPGPRHQADCEIWLSDSPCTCVDDDDWTNPRRELRAEPDSTAARLDRLCPLPYDGIGGDPHA